jgi:hypothetical protein
MRRDHRLDPIDPCATSLPDVPGEKFSLIESCGLHWLLSAIFLCPKKYGAIRRTFGVRVHLELHGN